MRSALVYVDEQLVVVNKAAGVSLATRRSEPNSAARRLLDSIESDELEQWGLASEDLRLVHRLDAGTTGLVLLARDGETHRKLARAFQTGSVEKTYLALTWGHPRPEEGQFSWPIGPDLSDRRRMKCDPAGRPSCTRYRTLARGPHATLLELSPQTGRTHQLRVHLARAGHIIVGDDLYGGARYRGIKDPHLRSVLNPAHLLLHAWKIVLPESCSQDVRAFEAPLPPAFRTALEELDLVGSLTPTLC
ncbi:MAG TPA: RluA family pseudouridine synthase [Acidobacteriota bacterium]|nr:RluA family pseudouridine synthase [Acidobacteriota bacterium]